MPSSPSPPISPSCAAPRIPRSWSSAPSGSALAASASRTATASPAWCGPIWRRRRRDCGSRSGRGWSLPTARPTFSAYPRDRAAWGRLTRLLSLGKLRAPKGECILRVADLEDFIAGLNLIVMAPPRIDAAALQELLERLKEAANRKCIWLAAGMLYRGDDGRRNARLAEIAAQAGVPLIAVNDVLYHARKRRALQDILTCIRAHTTIDAAGRLLEANAERHFKPPAEMARLFRKVPDAVRQTGAFLECMPLLARGAEEHRISGRDPQGLRHAAGGARRLCAGRRTAALSGRNSLEGAPRARRGAAADRRAQLCAVLSHRSRRGAIRPQRGEDSLPGARLGGQFGDLLLPRHHRRGSAQDRSSVRAFRLGRAARAARHRCRFRARAAREGDPAHLQDLHARARRPRRDRHLLSRPQRHSRRRQGVRAVGGHDRGARRLALGLVDGRRERARRRGASGSIRPIGGSRWRAPLRAC